MFWLVTSRARWKACSAETPVERKSAMTGALEHPDCWGYRPGIGGLEVRRYCCQILCNRRELVRIGRIGRIAALLQSGRKGPRITAGIECRGVARIVAQQCDVILHAALGRSVGAEFVGF